MHSENISYNNYVYYIERLSNTHMRDVADYSSNFQFLSQVPVGPFLSPFWLGRNLASLCCVILVN